MQTCLEKEKSLPVVAEVDVLVAGGGRPESAPPLGRRRNGAKTMLIEQANCLGGMATSGMMSHWCGGTESPLLDEIFARTKASPLLPPATSERAAGWATAHEAQKTALQELLLEAGVTLQYHTRIAGAVVEAGCVKGVITESKSGREVILAHTVIDATGDGDAGRRGRSGVRSRPARKTTSASRSRSCSASAESITNAPPFRAASKAGSTCRRVKSRRSGMNTCRSRPGMCCSTRLPSPAKSA